MFRYFLFLTFTCNLISHSFHLKNVCFVSPSSIYTAASSTPAAPSASAAFSTSTAPSASAGSSTPVTVFYLRYLDDIFGLWADMEASFRDFVAVLNSHHPQIKLKCNLQNQQVKFLDTVVFFYSHFGQWEQKTCYKGVF